MKITLGGGRMFCILGLLAAGGEARAGLIHYEIHNSGGMIVKSQVAGSSYSTPLSIAGGFTYNTSSKTLTNLDVTFTTDADFQRNHTAATPQLDDGFRVVFRGVNTSGINLLFQIDVTDENADPCIGKLGECLISAVWMNDLDTGFDSYVASPVDWSKVPYVVGWQVAGDSEAPEPSTWAMLWAGAALYAGRSCRKSSTQKSGENCAISSVEP